MGTSMGTIAAVALALGIADSAGMSIPLTAGVVLSGAMFGDNLSIISDTTIAATRSQGCEMRDKFKENIRILPAALIAIVIFAFNSTATQVPETGLEWLKVLPYITILILAVSGMNVFVVLTIGILLAGGVSLGSVKLRQRITLKISMQALATCRKFSYCRCWSVVWVADASPRWSSFLD